MSDFQSPSPGYCDCSNLNDDFELQQDPSNPCHWFGYVGTLCNQGSLYEFVELFLQCEGSTAQFSWHLACYFDMERTQPYTNLNYDLPYAYSQSFPKPMNGNVSGLPLTGSFGNYCSITGVTIQITANG